MSGVLGSGLEEAESPAFSRPARSDEPAERLRGATRREELIVFLVAFLSAAFFSEIDYQTSNFTSRFFLTQAIVDQNSVQLDAYDPEGFRMDRAYFEGHYYSDKPIGSSLMMLPQYVLLGRPARFVVDHLLPSYPTPNVLVGWIVQVSSLAVYAGLAFVALYRILGLLRLTHHRLALTLLSFFGTLMFPYSTIGMGEMFTVPPLLWALYFVIRGRSSRDMAAAGVCLGIAALITLQTVLILLVALLFVGVVYKRWNYLLWLGVPVAVAVAISLGYNQLVFGGLLEFPQKFWAAGNPPVVLYAWPTLEKLLQMTVLPWKGLFFYSPFLLLSIPGFVKLYRRQGWPIILLLAGSFAIYFVHLVFNVGWEGGSAFGFRYIVPALPFLCIGAAAWLSDRKLTVVELALIAASLAICVLGGVTDPHVKTDGSMPLLEFTLPFVAAKGTSNVLNQLLGVPDGTDWLLRIASTGLFFTAIGLVLWKRRERQRHETRLPSWEPPAGFAGTAMRLVPLLVVVLVAAFVRSWQLDVIPPGLHYDEAFHALEARRMVATGVVPLWLEGNFGVAPLFAFLVSISFRLMGESPLAERAVSVVVGTLTVLTTYGMAREVLGSRRLALLTALLMAVSFQSVVFSREGLEPHLVPLLLTVGVWLLSRGWRTGSWATFGAAGMALGLGCYTYQAYWLTPLIVVPLTLWRLAAEPGTRSPRWKQAAFAAAVALAVVAPLAPHLAAQVGPGNRLAQIAGAGSAAGQAGSPGMLENLGAVAGMFFLRGDTDPRNNLPGRPMLDPFQAAGFVAGLVVCARGWRRPETGLWLVWLVVMSLPVALSEYAPHLRRAIGLLPALAVVTALGFRGMWRAFAGSRLPAWLRTQAPAAVMVVGLLASGVAGWRDYFVLLGPSNDFYYAFDTGLADMARYANGLPSGDRVYYLPADNRHLTLQFQAKRPVPPSFESRRVWVLPPADDRATVYVAVTMEDAGAMPYLRQAFPTGSVVYEGKDREGGVYFMAFRAPAGAVATVRPAAAVTATLGTGVQVVGYGLDRAAPGRLTVTMTWQCWQAMDRDYTAFVQLVGPQGLAAQADGQPGGGSYPTTRWQPGETIVDRFVLDVSAVKPGNYRLVTGMYLLSTMQRLLARDAAGAVVAGDAVDLTVVSF